MLQIKVVSAIKFSYQLINIVHDHAISLDYFLVLKETFQTSSSKYFIIKIK